MPKYVLLRKGFHPPIRQMTSDSVSLMIEDPYILSNIFIRQLIYEEKLGTYIDNFIKEEGRTDLKVVINFSLQKGDNLRLAKLLMKAPKEFEQLVTIDEQLPYRFLDVPEQIDDISYLRWDVSEGFQLVIDPKYTTAICNRVSKLNKANENLRQVRESYTLAMVQPWFRELLYKKNKKLE